MEHAKIFEEYIIKDLTKVIDNEFICSVKSSKYKMGTKYIHFKLDENGEYKIINELIINGFEVCSNGIVKVNRGTGENNEELLYDTKIGNYILFPFNSFDKIENGYLKGNKKLKIKDETVRLVMFVNAEGKLSPQLYCTYDCEYYNINPDGSNIHEIIDMINKNAKKDGALFGKM